MKSLSNFITEALLKESLQSSWLLKLMKSVKEKGIKGVDLKNMYNGLDLDIRWDKVTDEYCKEYPAGSKEALWYTKQIIGDKVHYKSGLVLLIDSSENVIGTIARGCYITFFIQNPTGIWDKQQGYKTKFDTVWNAAKYFINKYKTVIYSFGHLDDPQNVIINNKYSSDGKVKRANILKGSVLQGNAEYYKRCAEENMERYKKLKKSRALGKQDTELENRIKAAINKVMKIALDVEANPDKYKLTYNIDYLLEILYSSNAPDKNPSKSKLVSGLLPLWKSYLKTKSDNENSLKNITTWNEKSAKKDRELIEKLLSEIENVIDNIK